jgi:hypothetical protein
VSETGPPELPEGEKSEFQQITFTLHESQAEIVSIAIDAAKKAGHGDSTLNDNSNGNALFEICAEYGRS